MTNLEELVLSRNRIVSWSVSRFSENNALSSLSIANNHDYINLTDAMISDFRDLSLLDLSDNDFLCNEGVVNFLLMTEEESSPEVMGWSFGYGYLCKDEYSGRRKSFKDFATNGIILEDPYTIPPNAEAVVDHEKPNYAVIVGPVLAAVILIPVFVVLANAAYNNRW